MTSEVKRGRPANTRSASSDEYFDLCSQILELCAYVKNGTITGNCDNCPKAKKCRRLYERYILKNPGRYVIPKDVILFLSEFGPLLKTMVKK